MPGADPTPFVAPEYHADGSIEPASYRFHGSPETGWEVTRNGAVALRLGYGYRRLQTSHCGVCSTDLARRHLPFPLPQVIGHEVVARDGNGALVVVEINASHVGRGVPQHDWCAFCQAGLSTHCSDRLVLGIHDLPGGFSPWLLAPQANVIPLPDAITPLTATLVEPFAAALHAVHAVAPDHGDRVAVLGPRRLGALVVAALAAWRRQSGRRYEIVAIARRAELRALVRSLGADDAVDAGPAHAMRDLADIVVETTGSPDGLALALQLARREVHVKSTTGRPTLGLTHLTEMVVDEITLDRLDPTRISSAPGATFASVVQLGDVPPALVAALRSRACSVLAADDAAEAARQLRREPRGAADGAVVTSVAGIDAALRPTPGIERGLVRACGTILVADVGQPRDALLAAVLDKGLRISTTRCGDFHPALDLLGTTDLGHRLGDIMVTSVLPADHLADAFALAASPQSIKVVVAQPGAQL
jgi:threonine dehydrogenase-like Zn-dependent dehydrogenase